MAQSRLRPIADGDVAAYFGDQTVPPPPEDPAPPAPRPSPPQPTAERVATTMLLTSLRALSQRTVIALGNLFGLVTAGSAFWLWLQAPPDPSVHQLVGLALYGVLILLLNGLVLRRR